MNVTPPYFFPLHRGRGEEGAWPNGNCELGSFSFQGRREKAARQQGVALPFFGKALCRPAVLDGAWSLPSLGSMAG